ncbi:MAG: SDR family NAD-dependent epimerase/dehydratase, partial [Acidobacteriota bacterium]|nr:SDR family NAD-dependent epimerase/dehydratase [Acidobacteriota bacterium]
EVICLDNFFTGRRENVHHLMGDRNFELLRHDVVEAILLEVDQIFNLACPASPIHYQHNPVRTSVMGTINIYHRQNGVDTRIARIFNTYGPRIQENYGRVVSNF